VGFLTEAEQPMENALEVIQQAKPGRRFSLFLKDRIGTNRVDAGGWFYQMSI
jgi:hypothetical protein